MDLNLEFEENIDSKSTLEVQNQLDKMKLNYFLLKNINENLKAENKEFTNSLLLLEQKQKVIDRKTHLIKKLEQELIELRHLLDSQIHNNKGESEEEVLYLQMEIEQLRQQVMADKIHIDKWESFDTSTAILLKNAMEKIHSLEAQQKKLLEIIESKDNEIDYLGELYNRLRSGSSATNS